MKLIDLINQSLKGEKILLPKNTKIIYYDKDNNKMVDKKLEKSILITVNDVDYDHEAILYGSCTFVITFNYLKTEAIYHFNHNDELKIIK